MWIKQEDGSQVRKVFRADGQRDGNDMTGCPMSTISRLQKAGRIQVIDDSEEAGDSTEPGSSDGGGEEQAAESSNKEEDDALRELLSGSVKEVLGNIDGLPSDIIEELISLESEGANRKTLLEGLASAAYDSSLV